MSNLLRRGRLVSRREDVVKFTSSIKDDVRIATAVLAINKAHTVMLVEQGIIRKEDGEKLLNALHKVMLKARYDEGIEDIHMYIEEEVFKIVGVETGGNLHVAKSRNDQVATAIRMKLRLELLEISKTIGCLQKALVNLAKDNDETIVIGHTHIQPAQPVTFGHQLISYVDSLQRDFDRIKEAYPRINSSPMGACALATTSFPISREKMAELLGFDGVLENSIDAIGTRDFLIEAMWCFTALAIDVGRIVEDLLLWSSYHFGVLELPNDFASTSSIMPQKKNPDLLEVMRARMKLVIGYFTTCINTVIGLPSSYNLDFQEITPLLWASTDQILECISMLAKLIPNLRVKREAILKKAVESLSTSTELANVMVRKYNVPFRTAHNIVGAIAKHLVDNGYTHSMVTSKLILSISHEICGLNLKMSVNDIKSALDPMGFVEAHNVRGGPSPNEVKRMIIIRSNWIDVSKNWIEKVEQKLKSAHETLNRDINLLTSND